MSTLKTINIHHPSATNTNIVLDSQGDVGIGTSTPAVKLHAAGSGTIARVDGSGTRFNGMSLNLTDASASNLRSSFIDTRNESDIAVVNVGVDSLTDGSSDFYIGTTPAGSRASDRRVERLRVSGNGTISVSSNILNLGTASLGTNGYSRLPNGLIFQWGTSASIAQDGSATVTFPLAFTTVYNIVITPIGAINTTSGGSDSVDTVTTSNFVIRHGSDSSRTFYWMAIGV
jgi:hypothetical protein